MQNHSQDQNLPIEEITSPLEGDEILEFCESELFPPDQNSEEGASTSNCCYEPDQSCYQTHVSNINNTFNPPNLDNEMAAPPAFDGDENDISASIDFSTSPTSFSGPNHQDQEVFNMSSLNTHLSYCGPDRWAMAGPMVPLSTSNYEEEYIRAGSSHPGVHDYFSFMGNGLMHQELDYEAGDNGAIFLPDMPTLYNCSTQLQGMSESQYMGVQQGGATSEISSSLEDASFKVGKISVEERKRKIHRYLMKRNQRNFSKKIKYECRKTLADSRPRVRGRFAKNDELMMMENMDMGSNHEHQTHLNHFENSMSHPPRKMLVKGEDEHDSSEIYAQISGVNSFKCTYPIQSWI